MSTGQLNIMPFFCLLITAIAVILPEPGAAVGVGEVYHCNTVAVQSGVDFDRAGEMCRDSRGELVSFESEESESSVLDGLLQDGPTTGHFWIGLRLPRGRCSNLSLPLRGYEWTAGSQGGSASTFTPSSSKWKENAVVCSVSCVSVSSDRRWTERPCSDKNPPALRTPRNAAQQVSDKRSVTIKSLKRCSDAPCQHTCTDQEGGYACSCFEGYTPDSKDPHQCRRRLLCQAEKCPITIDRGTGNRLCPGGFVESDDFCVDINECDMNHCDQLCDNSFGSFACSCKEGYVLKDEVTCIKGSDVSVAASDASVAVSISPRTVLSSPPAVAESLATAGGSLVWLWVVIAVALIVILSALAYWLVKRRRQRTLSLDQKHVVVGVQNISC